MFAIVVQFGDREVADKIEQDRHTQEQQCVQDRPRRVQRSGYFARRGEDAGADGTTDAHADDADRAEDTAQAVRCVLVEMRPLGRFARIHLRNASPVMRSKASM